MTSFPTCLRRLTDLLLHPSQAVKLARESAEQSVFNVFGFRRKFYALQAVEEELRKELSAVKAREEVLLSKLSAARSKEEALLSKLSAFKEAEKNLREKYSAKKAVEQELREKNAEMLAEIKKWHASLMEEIQSSADPRALRKNAPTRPRLAQRAPLNVVESWRPNPPPTVSFVLRTCNRLDRLKLAIESIREQALSVSSEIIVVDEGSEDGTIDWLVRQNDVLAIVQPPSSVAEGRGRRSRGYFMNLGFRAARGTWVCAVGDDCLLPPGCVEAALGHAGMLEASGRHVGGAAFYYRDWPKMDRYCLQYTLGEMLIVTYGLFLREALAEVGYAEELYQSDKVNSDLALKIWQVGYEVVVCPDSRVERLRFPSNGVKTEDETGLEDDQTLLVERWNGVFAHRSDASAFKGPKQEFASFPDPGNTAERFRPLIEDDLARQSIRRLTHTCSP